MAVVKNEVQGMNLAQQKSQKLPAERPNFGIAPTSGSTGLIQIQQTRELSQIMAEVMMAKQFPRDPSRALKSLEAACSRQTLAEHATYQYARGGTDITGPSIRLAEQLARSWENIKYGFNILDENDSASVVQAYAYDIECNIRAERQFVVPHVRGTKSGNKDISDPRDVYELCANNASRRVRACILQLIPSDVVDYAVDLCGKTLAASVKITPESIKVLCDWYKSRWGVSETQIAKRIQRNVQSMSVGKYLELKRIAESLKDQMSQPSDWFDEEEQHATAPQKPAEAAAAPKAEAAKAEQKNVTQAQEIAPEQEYVNDYNQFEEEDPNENDLGF